jgi:hypothetical protein
VRKDGEEIWETLRDEFFSFFPKDMDGEQIWGTLGDARSLVLHGLLLFVSFGA